MKISFFNRIFAIVLFVFSAACSTNPSQEQINQAKINTNLGLYYLQNGNNVLAKEKLLQALQENPKEPEANDAMGYFLEKTGEVKKAERYFINAIKYAKNKGNYQNNYGAFLYRQMRYSEAMAQFMEAVQDPNYLFLGHAYKNAGMTAVKLHGNDKAKILFAKAKMSDPSIEIPSVI